MREALTAMWRGETEVDSLNRLVIFSGLSWHQVQILRAYRRYRMRVSTRFTEEYRNDALARTPTSSRLLVGAVRGEVRPDPEHDARGRSRNAGRELRDGLQNVSSLDQDTIVRSLVGTIIATVRTNAYLSDRPALSFKIRSADVPEMPKPFPLFEIFVYSPQMEAIHLRGGLVARGGIRWSDRKEDYRTEVLGLMKAQKVKNAVIVPDGSKGGFILKRSVEPRRAQAGGRAQYVTFMRGLLDITDNLVDGAVDHPEGVRVLDGEDPYLVVAADKGTATFSDTANGIAEEYGFWLGDAFASGGAQGYDHKALGHHGAGRVGVGAGAISASSAVDVSATRSPSSGSATCPATCSATGCCYTDQVQLLAAFDHRNIFIDPDPTRRRRSPSASACSCSRGRRGPTTTAPCCRPAASSSTARRSRSRPRRRLGWRSACPTTLPTT